MQKLVLNIEYDENAESPREFENYGTMVCWHRRYNLGDKHNYSEPREFLESLLLEFESFTDEELGNMSMNGLREKLENYVVILPLFLYDHSIQSISCKTFIGRAQHAEWDSGQVGWIYMSYNMGIREFSLDGMDKDEIKERIIGYLEEEVESYDSYLRGEVYGYVLEQHTSCGNCPWCQDGEESDCRHMEIENIDSCWGFHGTNWKENGLAEQLGSDYEDMLEKLQGVGKSERILSNEE